MGDKKKNQNESQGGQQGRMRGKDIYAQMEIDFLEAVNGTQKSMTYAKVNKCETCQGTKMKPGTQEIDCVECGGSGATSTQYGHSTVTQMCGTCNGTGNTFTQCITCNGQGTVY